MKLTKPQRRKLAQEHTKVKASPVVNTYVCKHDRMLWPCHTAKLLWELQERERRGIKV